MDIVILPCSSHCKPVSVHTKPWCLCTLSLSQSQFTLLDLVSIHTASLLQFTLWALLVSVHTASLSHAVSHGISVHTASLSQFMLHTLSVSAELVETSMFFSLQEVSTDWCFISMKETDLSKYINRSTDIVMKQLSVPSFARRSLATADHQAGILAWSGRGAALVYQGIHKWQGAGWKECAHLGCQRNQGILRQAGPHPQGRRCAGLFWDCIAVKHPCRASLWSGQSKSHDWFACLCLQWEVSNVFLFWIFCWP